MRILLFLPPALLFIDSCTSRANFDAAEKASETFHHQMSAGQYDAIYENTTMVFKAATSRETCVGLCKRINRLMGTCEAARTTYKGFLNTSQGSFIDLNFTRSCANGRLEEQFGWQIVDGKAVLNRFNANNPLLLTE
jgi:hypothetical protein